MGISRKSALECVGPGWSRLINDLYDKKPKNCIVVQVKEKYGTLRFYADNIDENYLNLIVRAEEESAHICEQCGEPGEVEPLFGWYLCLCEKCHKERLLERLNG